MCNPEQSRERSPRYTWLCTEWSRLEGDDMNSIKIAALALVLAGVLGLIYGGFSYTKDTHEAKLGPIELSVKEKDTVNVPVWAGVVSIAAGAALLLFGTKKT